MEAASQARAVPRRRRRSAVAVPAAVVDGSLQLVTSGGAGVATRDGASATSPYPTAAEDAAREVEVSNGR